MIKMAHSLMNYSKIKFNWKIPVKTQIKLMMNLILKVKNVNNKEQYVKTLFVQLVKMVKIVERVK